METTETKTTNKVPPFINPELAKRRVCNNLGEALASLGARLLTKKNESVTGPISLAEVARLCRRYQIVSRSGSIAVDTLHAYMNQLDNCFDVMEGGVHVSGATGLDRRKEYINFREYCWPLELEQERLRQEGKAPPTQENQNASPPQITGNGYIIIPHPRPSETQPTTLTTQ